MQLQISHDFESYVYTWAIGLTRLYVGTELLVSVTGMCSDSMDGEKYWTSDLATTSQGGARVHVQRRVRRIDGSSPEIRPDSRVNPTKSAVARTQPTDSVPDITATDNLQVDNSLVYRR